MWPELPKNTAKREVTSDIKPKRKRRKIDEPSTSASFTIEEDSALRQRVRILIDERKNLLAEAKQIKAKVEQISTAEGEEEEEEENQLKQQLEKIQQELERINEAIVTLSSSIVRSLPEIDESGITSQHNIALLKFSRHNDVVIMWRPVNKEAANKLGSDVNPYMGKGLNIKGKSSEFGPIAGDIPYEAGLSKLLKSDPSRIDEFNDKNKKTIMSNEAKYQEIKDSVSRQNLVEINDLLLATKIVKKDPHDRTIYYFIDDDGRIIKNENVPIFAIKLEQEQWLMYSEDGKAFIKEIFKEESWHEKLVEIMAYRQFIIKETNEEGEAVIEEKYFPITADYDELVSAARKIYPFNNNNEIRTNFYKEMHDRLAHSKGLSREEIIDLVARLILAYEEKLKYDHRDAITSSQQPHMGSVNEWQRAVKAYLKAELGSGATTHGPEVNNPFPEKFTSDNYAVHLPDGNVIILHNEQEICDFINAQRKAGFPLDVNPKWGWEINEEGELFIPAIRFNWEDVHNSFAARFSDLQAQEVMVKELLNDLGLEDTDQNKTILLGLYQASGMEAVNIEKLQWLEFAKSTDLVKLRNEENKLLMNLLSKIRFERALTEGNAADKELIEIKVTIERLRLEPAIIYSWQPYSKIEEADDEAEFIEAVSELVRKMEHERRFAKISELENEAANLKKTYSIKYDDVSIIEKYEIELKEVRKEIMYEQSKNLEIITHQI